MTKACWCGSNQLTEYSPDYLHCAACETLVAREFPLSDPVAVSDEDQSLYGRDYWYGRQENIWGYPNIEARAWDDLPERDLHWLDCVLRYRQPPGRALEIGCAHGGFVALLGWAGFAAQGLELSPAIADYARRTFGIDVLTGPIEAQSIEMGSLDVIALMDVVEHFADPSASLRHCVKLLSGSGILVIQTPRYLPGRTYVESKETSDPFLQQLKVGEHLFLFSEQSLAQLLSSIGWGEVRQEKAIFGHYDQFVVAAKTGVALAPRALADFRPAGSPSQRVVQALLDLRTSAIRAEEHLAVIEADRAARLAVIHDLGGRLAAQEKLNSSFESFRRTKTGRLLSALGIVTTR